MESIFYNVTDLSADQRHTFEGVIGQPLRDDQQLVIHVSDATPSANAATDASGVRDGTAGPSRELPDWVTIFADLSDAELSELEAAILDRSESRPHRLP